MAAFGGIREGKFVVRKRSSHSGNNDLALSYRIDSLPSPVRRVEVWNAMERFITRGEELPDDWEITLRWRNSPKQPWREDEFQTAINESRQGFVGLVLDRIRRDHAAWEGIVLPKPPREKLTLEDIEDLLGEDFESLDEARRALREATVVQPKRRRSKKGAASPKKR